MKSPSKVYAWHLSLHEKSIPGQWRMIHDLSFPYTVESINLGIPQQFATVKYVSVMDAIKVILHLKNNVYMAKSDIKLAFQITGFLVLCMQGSIM